MKIVGVGKLVTDYYYVDKKCIGVCGGMTSFNILANLANVFETYAIGKCGDDEDGKVAINSLRDLGVNTKYVNLNAVQTSCFFVDIKKDKCEVECKRTCPICGRMKWNDDNFDIKIPEELKNKDSVIVLDRITDNNIEIAKDARKNGCAIFIDIGHKSDIIKLNNEEIISKISNKFDFIQINCKVAKILVERFNFKDMKELNSLFNAKLLIITYGKDGVEFVWNENNNFYKLENPSEELDPTGAGDLFFSIAIKNIINNDFNIDEILIDNIYKEATKETSKLVKKVGARALVQPLYEVKVEEGKCSCGLEIEKND